MGRLTDNDKKFGPITYGKTDWHAWRLVWCSGDTEETEHAQNTLTAYVHGWVARINVPNIIRPFRVKHTARYWSEEDIARMGRDWYYETFPREYGFSLHDGFLQVFLGAQTHDSVTTQSWSKFLPWTQWRFVRKSLYDLKGEHFWTEPPRSHKLRPEGTWDEIQKQTEAVPKAVFEFDDYDGKRIRATTHIEEREWKFGEGWFKWLSLFRSAKVRRDLDIAFSEEVGPEKGSWKGGTLGHGIEMLPGELHEDAFRRYCDQEHRSKYRKYQITYVGRVE